MSLVSICTCTKAMVWLGECEILHCTHQLLGVLQHGCQLVGSALARLLRLLHSVTGDSACQACACGCQRVARITRGLCSASARMHPGGPNTKLHSSDSCFAAAVQLEQVPDLYLLIAVQTRLHCHDSP